MGLSINQNIAALNSYRNLSVTQNDLSKSLEKLSSGFRINRAADDAAGLAISEGLRSQVGGLKVAVRNAQDGISVVQTAEGALTETHSILQRMRDLSVQAANTGGLSADAKGNIQSEMSQLNSELTRIADTTQFNGAKLLDGTYTQGTFQVGANVGEVIEVSIGTSMSANGLGVDTIDVQTDAQAGYVRGLEVGDEVTAATSASSTFTFDATGITATDAAFTVAIDGTSKTVQLNTGGINTADELVSALNTAFGSAVASNDAGAITIASATTGTTSTVAFTTSTGGASNTDDAAGAAAVLADAAAVTANDALASGADKAIKAIDVAIKSVSTTRADLGAVQNRFDHTVKNLNVAVENLSASESRIRDTDMASEMVQFTRAQILSQAGTAMLAQANQIPQGVLSLLR